jgi:hypothetical protein
MKNKYSIFSLSLCYILMFIAGFIYFPKWEMTDNEATISWDVSGYYLYLPATFIYKDVKKLSFNDSMLVKYKSSPLFQAFKHESGNYVMKYPAGQAVMMSPFFFIGHAFASNSDQYPPDGFSYPYQKAIGIGLFLYALIGLFVLRKVLLRYYKDTTVAIVLIALVFGTNYLDFSSIDQGMTHNTLFMLYSIVLYQTILFYEKLQFRRLYFIAFLIGLMTLIRPTEVIAVIIPVFWGISSWAELKQRISFIAQHILKYIVCIVPFIAVISLQLIYWKWVSGSWIVYSYEEQGFTWFPPHLKNYLFSYRSGWLLYCPMMILAFVGVFPYVSRKQNILAVGFYFFVSLYIVSAWDIWWYGGRAMIQSYPVLAFIMAAFIQFIHTKRLYTYIFYPIFVFFIYYNLWWTHHSHRGNIQVVESTKGYFWATVCRWEEREDDKILLDNPDLFPKPKPILKPLYTIRLSEHIDSLESNIDTVTNSINLNKINQFSPRLSFQWIYPKVEWIRVSANFKAMPKEWDIWKMTQMVVEFKYKGNLIKSNLIRLHRLLNTDEWKEIDMDVKVPKGQIDRVEVNFWNAGSDNAILIQDIQIMSME